MPSERRGRRWFDIESNFLDPLWRGRTEVLLKGVIFCCKERILERWRLDWQEDKRFFKLVCRSNKDGKFILCTVEMKKRKSITLSFHKEMVW